MKKAQIILMGIAVLLLMVVAGCGQADSTNKENTIEKKQGEKVTTIRFGHTTVPSMLAVAKEEGFFEEEFKKDGIAIEYDKFLSGPPLIEAFAGERLDFGQVGDQPAIQAKANNIKIKAVGVYSSGSKSIGLVVPEGSKINSIKDLKGKKVGVTVGSVGHRLLNAYLEENGLSPKDIQQINLQPPDIKTAIEQKNIDATVTYEPWISTMEEQGIGHQVLDATGLLNSYSLYVVSESFAKNHPEIVERVLKVLDKAEKWSQEHPDKAIEDISKLYGTDKKIVEKSMSRINYDIRLKEEAIDSIGETSKALRENKVIRKDVDVNDLVDASYLEKIGIQ
ncbi:ABC transporter substrate-binding protein [Niallia sp. NCCP-28]|uniref:ABC transporter substrate-binding protein n=1 Tax=Niallia sp. NCCP-28 TaxID=2934712 RepID=UPI00208D3974|nr:aliphatic sulfonate ABC transporter substrate-binding protein [Niallia sp. NCCP-28]GKU84722.1 sulfonate ABC transporter substrate-binding protein [Niallia sp. NCCP-28]